MDLPVSEMIDVTAPKHLEIEIQDRPQFGKDTRVLYVHADGQTVLRVCRIPDSLSLTVRKQNQKPFAVYFWHGTPNKNSEFYKKVMTLVRENEGILYFDGDLNEWKEKWGSHFLFYPRVDEKAEGSIYITPHSNYNPRG